MSACAFVELVVTFVGIGTAHAGGISAARFGSDHGTPAQSNPYAVYFNPAALGGTTGTEIVVDGTFAVRSLEYSRPLGALSPSDDAQAKNATYRNANTGDASALNVLAVPYLGIVTDLGSKSFRLGFATYVPFGGAAKWNQLGSVSGQAPGAIDGPQRWSIISGQQSSLFNTLALAYRFERPRISIGASGSLVLNSAKSLRARNADGSDDVVTTNGGLQEGRALLDASNVDIAASVGAFWEATRFLRFGASYNFQPGFGQQRLSGTFLQQFGTTAQQATSQKIDFLTSLPDVIRIGMAWRASPDFELRADAVWERWSRMKNQCVVLSGQACNINPDGSSDGSGSVIANFPRAWKDSFGVRTGIGYWLTQETELFVGGSFGTPAIPKKTVDALYFDAFSLGASVGVRHQIVKGFYGALSYNYIYDFPFDVTPTQSTLNRVAAPSNSPSAAGHYAEQVYFFNANMTYRF